MTQEQTAYDPRDLASMMQTTQEDQNCDVNTFASLEERIVA